MPKRISSDSPCESQDNPLREAIDLLLDAGNWFPFFSELTRIMSIQEAVLLQYLANVGGMKKNGGWFVCTRDQIHKKFNGRIDRNAQTKALNFFQNLGILKIEKRGIPAKRYLWIDSVELFAKLKTKTTCPQVDTKSCPLDDTKSCQHIVKNELNKEESSASRSGHARSARTPSPQRRQTLLSGEVKELSSNEKWARRLHKVVSTSLQKTISFRPGLWEESFRLLHTSLVEHGNAAERIERVLAWYEKEGHKGTFTVESASAFRKHFSILERNAKKSAPVISSAPDDPKTLAVLARLKPLQWPKNSLEQLPAAVNASISAHRKYRARFRNLLAELRGIKSPTSKQRDLINFMRWMEQYVARPSEDFVVAWFEAAYKSVRGWAEWNGDLTRYIWSEDHTTFQANGAGLASKYGDQGKMWPRLVAEMEGK